MGSFLTLLLASVCTFSSSISRALLTTPIRVTFLQFAGGLSGRLRISLVEVDKVSMNLRTGGDSSSLATSFGFCKPVMNDIIMPTIIVTANPIKEYHRYDIRYRRNTWL